MLEFWSFRVVEVSSVRILKLSGCLVSEFSFEFFELSGSQVVRVFEFSRIRVFEFSSCRDFEFSSCRVVGCPSCGVFEFSGFRVFEFSSFRDFEFSNFRVLLGSGTDGGRGGGCVQNHNKHIGQSSFSCLWNWVGAGGASGLKRGGCNRLLIICLRITAHLFTNATMQCHKNVQLREAVVTAHLRVADAVVTAP